MSDREHMIVQEIRKRGVDALREFIGHPDGSRVFSIRTITPGWEFVNLFCNRNGPLFHCRIRKIDPQRMVQDWQEITAAGATMQIAFDRVNEEAAAAS